MNVYQKLNEVKKLVKSFIKDSATSGTGAYKYTSGAQVLGAIKEKMESIGLLFLPIETESKGWTTFNYKNSRGDEKTDFIVSGKLVYEWINIDEPTDRQRVEFEYYGQQNDISKAFGSALTYSERYLLLKSLGAPTDEDDPDRLTEEKKGTTKASSTAPESISDKPISKFQQLKKFAVSESVSLTEICEYAMREFGAEKLNDLTDNQVDNIEKHFLGLKCYEDMTFNEVLDDNFNPSAIQYESKK